MAYLTKAELRDVWGLEDRAYSDEEVLKNDHLQWAVHAGALVDVEETRREPNANFDYRDLATGQKE